MNLYVFLNSFIYVVAWNAWLLPKSEVPSLVLGWSLLLFVPLVFISSITGGGKDEKFLRRSFKGERYDRLMFVLSFVSGIVGSGCCVGLGYLKSGDWAIIGIVCFVILNAALVAGTQLGLHLKKR